MFHARFAFACGLIAALSCWCATPALAQPGGKPNDGQPNFNNGNDALLKSIVWQHGPCKVTMRSIGEMQVPAGFKFTGESGTATMMKATRNLPNPGDLGLLCPENAYSGGIPGPDEWFLVFEWDAIGYVKDDEKGNIDANAILESMKNAQVAANPRLQAQGFPALTIVGWEQAPFYDDQLKMVSWGTRVRSVQPGPNGEADTINYNTKILGREGVVSANLVIAPHLLNQNLPRYKELVKAFAFQNGQKYSEWRAGDKVAAMGLTALISGGVVAAAAKSGLLAKFGKFIIYIVVGACAVIGGIFKKIFGGRSTAAE